MVPRLNVIIKKITTPKLCNEINPYIFFFREDNFKTEELPWISSLRFASPDEIERLKNKKSENSGANANPPSFYEKDLEKWTSSKFEKAIEERRQLKQILAKQKQDLTNITTKNLNLKTPEKEEGAAASTLKSMKTSIFSPPKRRMSRQSNRNFSNVDFNYIGDTGAVSHLIKRRIGGNSPTQQQLGFELNLRNYQCDTTFKAPEPFMFPRTRQFHAVEADKTAFPMTMPTSPKGSKTYEVVQENSEYDDMFKLRNMGAVRHSFLPGKMSLSSLQHESNLRCNMKTKPLVPEKITTPRIPLKLRKEGDKSATKE